MRFVEPLICFDSYGTTIYATQLSSHFPHEKDQPKKWYAPFKLDRLSKQNSDAKREYFLYPKDLDVVKKKNIKS